MESNAEVEPIEFVGDDDEEAVVLDDDLRPLPRPVLHRPPLRRPRPRPISRPYQPYVPNPLNPIPLPPRPPRFPLPENPEDDPVVVHHTMD